jgi:hypothetical protein
MNWDSIGWKIRVNFNEMQNQVRPKDHMLWGRVGGPLLTDA